jgi:hypothetical protein
MDKRTIGSLTAIGGFLNEVNICEMFQNYANDTNAQNWLSVMGYDHSKIQNLNAIGIPPRISKSNATKLGITNAKFEEAARFKKADIQVKIEIILDGLLYVENISLKKANRGAGFNQVDKRPVSTYKSFWHFNDRIEDTLKLFTGEILPENRFSPDQLNKLSDQRRVFLNELPNEEVAELIHFFESNKVLVITDILRGRGGFSADWFLVTRMNKSGEVDWTILDINSVCNFYCEGVTQLSPRGSLKIGRVTMQRKGGTPDPTSLQFKINPLELFDRF